MDQGEGKNFEFSEPLAKIPNSHPERSGPKGRAVEGSPPEKERAPRKAKHYLTCGDPSTHSSNSLSAPAGI